MYQTPLFSLPEAERLARRVSARITPPTPYADRQDVYQEAMGHILTVWRPGVYEADNASTRGVSFDTWLFVQVLGKTRDTVDKEWDRMIPARPRSTRVRVRTTPFSQRSDDPEYTGDSKQSLCNDVQEAVRALPHRQRFVVTEVYLKGTRQQDVAARLGISQPAVYKILRSALATLKGQL